METNLQTQIADIQYLIVLTTALLLVVDVIFKFAINPIQLVRVIRDKTKVTRTQTTLKTTRHHGQSFRGAQQINISGHYSTNCT